MPRYPHDPFTDIRKIMANRMNELYDQLGQPETMGRRQRLRGRIYEIKRIWMRYLVFGVDPPRRQRRGTVTPPPQPNDEVQPQ